MVDRDSRAAMGVPSTCEMPDREAPWASKGRCGARLLSSLAPLMKLFGRRDRRWDPRWRRIALIVAAVFLAVGFVLALREHPSLLSDLRWGPIALLLLLAVPLTVMVNAAEFALIGRMVGQTIPFRRSIEITILVSAANLLPLPGGAIVRVVALKTAGTHYGKGTAATLLAAVVWIGVSLLYAGIWIALHRPGVLSALFICAGAGALVLSAAVVLVQQFDLRSALGILAVRSLLVLIDAVRLYLCLLALSFDASFAQASAFSVASAAGSAISIVPGGLGISEAVTAALAPLVGLPAAAGFLAAALNRLIGMPLLVPFALWHGLRGQAASPDAPERTGFHERNEKGCHDARCPRD